MLVQIKFFCSKELSSSRQIIALVFLQVVVLVNDGTREFFTKVSPKQGVCSGSWHKITGKNSSVITL